MKKQIAIIGAMNEEVEALTEMLTDVQEQPTTFIDLPVKTGNLAGQPVIVARCGIGKVNAALATQYIIDRFAPNYIINTGVAGGVHDKVRIGDLVLGNESLQHDFDAQNFGYPKGVIPRLKSSIFTADSNLIQIARKAAQLVFGKEKVHQGLIVSGDQFVSSSQQKQEILAAFPATYCVEMEGAAIAQVAQINQVRHLIVRAISDQADNTAPDDFNQYLLEIIPALNSTIKELVKNIQV